jgi:uncharacterized membrane protein YbaN (DUF454 family)
MVWQLHIELQRGKGISAKGKVLMLFLLWITIGYSAYFLMDTDIIQMVLLFVAIAVSARVLTLHTFKKKGLRYSI